MSISEWVRGNTHPVDSLREPSPNLWVKHSLKRIVAIRHRRPGQKLRHLMNRRRPFIRHPENESPSAG